MLHGVFVPMDHGNERPCQLGFTWCNPNYISILFLTKTATRMWSKKGLADFMSCRILSSYSKCFDDCDSIWGVTLGALGTQASWRLSTSKRYVFYLVILIVLYARLG